MLLLYLTILCKIMHDFIMRTYILRCLQNSNHLTYSNKERYSIMKNIKWLRYLCLRDMNLLKTMAGKIVFKSMG